MNNGDSGYSRFVKIMREKHLTPAHPEILFEKSVRKVIEERERVRDRTLVSGLFMGWEMVGWTGRSVAFVSLILVALFIYQQYEIMSGIRDIRERMKAGNYEIGPSSSGVTVPGMIVLTGRYIGPDSIRMATRDIERLIESYTELEMTWNSIISVLERNPQLLRRIERAYGETIENLKNKPIL